MLAGCGALKPKDGAPSATDAETAEKKTEAAADGEKKTEPSADAEKKDEEKKKDEPAADAPPTPGELHAAALAAEEFKGVSKAEAEFMLANRALAAAAKDKATFAGREGLVFRAEDARELGANRTANSGRHKSIVATLSAYAKRLREAGIEFVLAPVPPKPVVYPDYLGGDIKLRNRRYDSYLRGLYAELEKTGVRVVDDTRGLGSGRFGKQGGTYPRAGGELSPVGVKELAEAIHKSVRRTDAVKQITRDEALAGAPVALTVAGESFAAVKVGRQEEGKFSPVKPGREGAVVVVVGDAHALAYAKDQASLADHLALAFGTAAETRGEKTLGWKSAPGRFSPGKKTAATKVVVWAFSATDFLKDPSAPKPAAPRRPATRSASSSASPSGSPSIPTSGGALRLRDTPDLEVRSE